MNILKQTLTFLFIGLAINLCHAQNPIKTHQHQSLVWLGYFGRIELSEKFAVTGDYQFRRNNWLKEWSQKVFRQELTYIGLKNIDLSAGFAYLHHHKNNFIQNEYRPYQQVLLFNDFAGFKVDHRYRFEQRFLQKIENNRLLSNYFFNYRIRYKLSLGVPIKVKGQNTAWMVLAENELMINFGDEVFINMFDQNRFFAGIDYKIDKSLKIQAGYMRIFAQQATIGLFDHANIIRLNLLHTISLGENQ